MLRSHHVLIVALVAAFLAYMLYESTVAQVRTLRAEVQRLDEGIKALVSAHAEASTAASASAPAVDARDLLDSIFRISGGDFVERLDVAVADSDSDSDGDGGDARDGGDGGAGDARDAGDGDGGDAGDGDGDGGDAGDDASRAEIEDLIKVIESRPAPLADLTCEQLRERLRAAGVTNVRGNKDALVQRLAEAEKAAAA